MLFRINNDHGMLDGTSNIAFRCAAKSHVSNKIGNNPHLFLFFLFLHEAHAIGISFGHGICNLGVEVFQILQSGGGFNIDFARLWNCYNRIAIKISTRQTFCNLCVDANCILHIAEIPAPGQILIIDRYNRNLEGSCMRKTNQCQLSAIRICRTIAFSLSDFGQWQNNLCRLTRERRCFQGHRVALASICEIKQQLFPNRRIVILHNLVIFCLAVGNSKIQLLFQKFDRLFGQKLRRKVLCHGVPITFFF